MRAPTTIGIVCLLTALAANAAAHKDHKKTNPAATAQPEVRPQEAAEPDDFEAGFDDMDDVEVVAVEAVETVEPEQETGLLALVGYLHPASVHMPIGWLMLLVIVEVLAIGFNRRFLFRFGLPLAILTLLSFIPAAVTGMVRHDVIGGGTEALIHRNFMFATMGWLGIAITLRYGQSELRGLRRWVYLGALLLAGVLVTIGGHLGGQMVFGELPI